MGNRKLMSESIRNFYEEQDKLTVKPDYNTGCLYLIMDDDGEPIQVWRGAESIIQEHCKKYDWCYT